MTIWTTAVLALLGAEPPKEKPLGEQGQAPVRVLAERVMLTTQCEKCHSAPATKCPGCEVAFGGLVNLTTSEAVGKLSAARTADDVAESLFVADARLAWTNDQGKSWKFEPASATLRSHLQLPDEVGLVVTQIGAKSLAAEAGLKKDDVLVFAAERALKTHKDLDEVASSGKDSFVCQIVRAGKPIKLDLMAKAVLADPTGAWVAKRDNPPRVGVSIAAVDDALRAQIPALASKGGVIVTAVTEKSPAAEAGLKVHDIVARLADKEVKTEAEFREIVQANENNKLVVEFVRAGKQEKIVVVPQRPTPESLALQYEVRAGQPLVTLLTREVQADRIAHGDVLKFDLSQVQPTKVVAGQPLDPARELAALQADLAKMQVRLATLSKALADRSAVEKKKK